MINCRAEIGDIYKDWQGDYHALILDSLEENLYLCLHLESGSVKQLYFDYLGWIQVA